MASNPQLPNHLIRELTNIIRLRGDGEAMVRLALSGKEPLSVFEFVVNTHTRLYLSDDYTIKNLEGDSFDPASPPFERSLTVFTEGAQRLFSRFVLNLGVTKPDVLRMPIDWANLNDLTMSRVSDSFVAGAVNGTILLANLRKLELTSTFDQYLKLLSTTSCFSLPEDVTLYFYNVNDGDLTDVVSFQTFPKVKRFSVQFFYIRTAINVDSLHQFSTVIKYFPNLETAKLYLYYEHDFHPRSFADIVTVKEQLCNASFSVPVDIYYKEQVVCNYRQNPEYIYGRLESIGFKRSYIYNNYFKFNTTYNNVKLQCFLEFM